MIKKYYWLKLKEDFFEEDAISWLEEQKPNGKEYSLFYLKLCLKSLKTNGILIRNVGTMIIPYDMKKLAEITKTEFDTVVVAMDLLKQIGLVQILENGEIYLPMLCDMVGSETDKAQLMRKLREQKKIESQMSNNVTSKLLEVTDTLPKCYTEIEIEKEIEKEKEIEIEKEKKKKKTSNYQDIITLYNTLCVSYPRLTKLSDTRMKALKARINQGYTIEDFEKLFLKAESSTFLKGGNERNWSASFDWLIKDRNIAKVLDGNYDDNKKGKSNEPRRNNTKDSEGFTEYALKCGINTEFEGF